MKLFRITITALLAGALLSEPAVFAQSRRESPSSRPQRSKVENRSENRRSDSKPAVNRQETRPERQKVDRKPSETRRPSVNNNQQRRPERQKVENKSSESRRPSVNNNQQRRPERQKVENKSSENHRPSVNNNQQRRPERQKVENRPMDNTRRPTTRPNDTHRPGGFDQGARRPSPGQDRHPEARPGDRHDRPVHTPPPHRKPVSYRDPCRFYDHGHHYYGYRVNRIPHHHDVRIHWGHKYYVSNGVYYRLYDGVYYVCRPPYGFYFSPTVYAYTPHICSFTYYNIWDRQYDIIDENYRVIEQQNRIIAQNNALIASQNTEINALNEQYSRRSTESYALASQLGLIQSYAAIGTNYYYDDGVFFTKNSRGEYETIIPPAGAIINELPDDYQVVTLKDGKEYYLVDDTIYRVIIGEDGKACFEVLGQVQK